MASRRKLKPDLMTSVVVAVTVAVAVTMAVPYI